MPKYAAPTPDEIALVKGAFINGVELRGRTSKTIQLAYSNKFNEKKGNSKMEFEILDSLEFSSERRRSSVILKDQNGMRGGEGEGKGRRMDSGWKNAIL